MWRFCLIFCLACHVFSGETISFPSSDGLELSADVSLIERKDAPFMLLCHQAGWSRGEYKDTSRWFNELGFHVLALDQRSGREVKGVPNLTAKRAQAKGLPTEYLDAKQDIEAAIAYIQKTYAPKKLILLGSSYSASLVLRIAGENRFPIDGVLAFSPGEYFKEKPKYVQEKAAGIKALVFVTSAAKEIKRWEAIAAQIPKDRLNAFVPREKGEHGSRALWEGKSGWPLYRRATQAFLARFSD